MMKINFDTVEPRPNRTSVLMIGIANSIHTARWVEQFKDEPIDLTLIPSTPSRSIHQGIRTLAQTDQELKVLLPKIFHLMAFPIGVLDYFLGRRLMGFCLGIWLLFRKDKFDIVHAMELQHAGYILSSIKPAMAFDKQIISNWGSDIYWYQRFPRHRKRLQKLLASSTHYSCECNRDIALATNLGFTGTSFDVQPNAGPISLENINLGAASIPPSQRRRIIVKGYTGFVGRADLALAAISLCAVELQNYEICLYSSDRRSRRIARSISRKTGLKFLLLKKYEMTHGEILQLFRESRIYLGISMSDGISTSLLEAIASGTFPIQSNTSCADEWVENDVNGYVIDWENAVKISEFVKKALLDDKMVDEASALNYQIALERLTPESMGKNKGVFYSL